MQPPSCRIAATRRLPACPSNVVRLLQVAKIKRLFQISSDPQDVELEVSWFYRPEEAVGGRKVRGPPAACMCAAKPALPCAHLPGEPRPPPASDRPGLVVV